MAKGILQGAIILTAALWSLPSGAVAVPGQGTWESTLQARYFDTDTTPDAYYDTVLGITWLANANAGLGTSYDTAGGGASDGRMALSNATGWASSLTYAGGGWRLPNTGPLDGTAYNYSPSNNGSTDYGYNQSAPGTTYAGSTGSEMAHLFFNTLGNLAYCHPTSSTAGSCSGPQSGWQLTNTGPFSNLQSGYYWSGTAYAPVSGAAWVFHFAGGYQGADYDNYQRHAWAVHSGDVGAPAPVPLPAAAWLLGSGLIGLFGVARRARRPALG